MWQMKKKPSFFSVNKQDTDETDIPSICLSICISPTLFTSHMMSLKDFIIYIPFTGYIRGRGGRWEGRVVGWNGCRVDIGKWREQMLQPSRWRSLGGGGSEGGGGESRGVGGCSEGGGGGCGGDSGGRGGWRLDQTLIAVAERNVWYNSLFDPQFSRDAKEYLSVSTVSLSLL